MSGSLYEVLYAVLTKLAKLVAPFLPFLAESIHAALGGAGSVHLEDWPEPRPGWRNDELMDEMRRLRATVQLARRAREQNDIKHRHPLSSVSIGGLTEAVVANNRVLLEEELNVKAVRNLASSSELLESVVRLNFAALGVRLKSRLKAVTAAVRSGDYQLENDGIVLVAGGERLTGDEFSLELRATDGVEGVAAAGGIVVAFDLDRTPRLVAEGYARDLNRGLQDLRKAAELQYTDRIDVTVMTSDELWATLEPHLRWLSAQLLADTLGRDKMANPLASRQLELASESVVISLKDSVRSTST